MRTHTPGPWRIAEPKIADKDQKDDRLIYGPDLRHVAEVFQYQSHQFPTANGEALANARLIAAAPELLDALIHIHEYWNGDYNERAMSDALDYVETVAWTAIKKVVPESQGAVSWQDPGDATR
jgi:hypothetical protein